MKRLQILLSLVICMGFGGCARPSLAPEPPVCRVVTEIWIQVENTPDPGQIRYSDPKKMTKALNYLRCLKLWDRPTEKPESDPGARYRITLHYSDGSTAECEQIGSRYFRRADEPWMMLPREYGLRLPLILVAIKSDTIFK